MPCPFLGSDKYCSIYEDRPNACREYPHLHQRNSLQKLGITYQNSLICPAVALALEKLKTHFDFAGWVVSVLTLGWICVAPVFVGVTFFTRP